LARRVDSYVRPSYLTRGRSRRVNFERAEGARSISYSATRSHPIDALQRSRATVRSQGFAVCGLA